MNELELKLYDAASANYTEAVRRRKINPHTTENDFLLDIQKELAELLSAKNKGDISYFNSRVRQMISSTNTEVQSRDFLSDELYVSKYKQIMSGTKTDEVIDTILVLFSYCVFSGIDIESAMKAKIKYNQLRDRENKKEPSCLEYLLDLFKSGKRFDIYYNSDHCIGLSGTTIIEKDSYAFKKSIENGEEIRYFELTKGHSEESIAISFQLSAEYGEILKQYYEYKQRKKE